MLQSTMAATMRLNSWSVRLAETGFAVGGFAEILPPKDRESFGRFTPVFRKFIGILVRGSRPNSNV